MQRAGQRPTWLGPWQCGLVCVLLGVQLEACGGSPPPACGLGGVRPHPEVGGQVVYECYAGTSIKGDLFLLDVTTGDVRRLTNSAWNFEASWSSDGRRIAFESTRDGRFDIYAMDVASGVMRRLTDGRGFNGYPSWAPDGQWIAFESTRDGVRVAPDPPGYYPDIYVMRADGSDAHRLLSFRAVSSAPVWSPAGDRIAFSSDRSGEFELYTVAPDGTDVRRVTDRGGTGGYAWVPRWSPDGTRIVFYSARSLAGNPSIYWVASDGGDIHRVTDAPGAGWDAYPDWSGDGRWIVFTRGGADQQLFAVRPDGSDLTQLTADGGAKGTARWRPS